MFSFKILRGKLARGWQKIIHLGMRRRLTAVLGCSLSRAQKTWLWSLLFKVFRTGNIAAKLRYLQIERKFTARNKITFYLFIYISKSSSKVATAKPFCLNFERAKVKTSRKFATSPDILVANAI